MAHTLKAKGTNADTFTATDLMRCASWCLTNFKGPAQTYIGLRDRAMLLTSCSVAFRGDSTRAISSLNMAQQAARDETRAYMLALEAQMATLTQYFQEIGGSGRRIGNSRAQPREPVFIPPSLLSSPNPPAAQNPVQSQMQLPGIICGLESPYAQNLLDPQVNEVSAARWVDPGSSSSSNAMPAPLFSLPPDLFPGAYPAATPLQPAFPASISWDTYAGPSSWLPQQQQLDQLPARWEETSAQAYWDDLLSSLQSTPAHMGSSGSDCFSDGYGIDHLMGDVSHSDRSSRFTSAAPSSIPDDDWASGWSSSGSRPLSAAPSSVYDDWPSVSVEIGSWNDGNSTADSPHQPHSPEPDVDLVDEAPEMEALLGWQWKPSDVKWLDPGVSSEVVEFPNGIYLTGRTKIYALHRVKGCPSQFPFPPKRTAYLVDFTEIADLDPEMTVDDTVRGQDPHSWTGGTGARNKPDAKIPGSFFGLTDAVTISVRRADPYCGGISACEALDSAFLNEERRTLDPEPARKLAAAVLRTREMQDDTDVGRTLAFHHSLQDWRCKGIRADGARCGGSIALRKLNTPIHHKEHILLCSKRTEPLAVGSSHSQALIHDNISEDLFVKVMNGERIIEEDDAEGTCSRVVSGRTGQKGKHQCPFNHHKNGLPYVAQIVPVTCRAKMNIYCPWESLHPELARMALVVPKPDSGHTHPPPPKARHECGSPAGHPEYTPLPPPPDKVTPAVAQRYKQCVRKIGLGATVARVENAQSTKDLLDGKTPSLFHLALTSRTAKTRLIQEVKLELNASSSTTTNTRQQVAAYLADQEALSDEERYLQSSQSRDGKRIIFGANHKLLSYIHDLRTLDCDTTFKPVVGKMQIFEINGWLVAINESVTVMRVWMEIHDRDAYRAVWQEVQRLVVKHTRKKLKFIGLHKGGKILGLNADMEAAPLLGFADALVDTVDLDEVRAVVITDAVMLLLFVLRLCYTHYDRGVPKLLHLSAADRRRISELKYAKTVDEVEAFKTWIVTLPDPDGTLKRWWTHKTMHTWLLPGFIQCLSRIPLERWNSMDATTNLGEAQHAWNNAQTGTSMGVIESFKKYEELDARRAAEIEMRMATAISRNSHNESRGFEKGRRARATDANVAALETELLELKEELETARADEDTEQSAIRDLVADVVEIEGKLKLAKAEAKSNSSGRVRAPKARKANTTPTTSNLTTEPTPGASTSTLPSELPPSAVIVGEPVSDARRVSSPNNSLPFPPSSSLTKSFFSPTSFSGPIHGSYIPLSGYHPWSVCTTHDIVQSPDLVVSPNMCLAATHPASLCVGCGRVPRCLGIPPRLHLVVNTVHDDGKHRTVPHVLQVTMFHDTKPLRKLLDSVVTFRGGVVPPIGRQLSPSAEHTDTAQRSRK
ncbi:hypothetical protein DFH06DRAFT_1393433 [Mycena polygramma]|nr:hypothetical protein DFH06DRAFT_1393433 [Mycena polygramma]